MNTTKLYKPLQAETEYNYDNIPFIMEGLVVDTNDPDQMGRLRVWVPAMDGETYDVAQLPWAEYASPFLGFTADYPAGENMIPNHSHAAYGFWAIPKMGATVLVFCLNGLPSLRFYFASTARLHRNRSMPAGRNTDFLGNQGPFGDAGDGSGKLNPIEPQYSNLRTQFQNKMKESETLTRGGYERQVAQQKETKDGTEGYSKSPADASFLDPQTYCITTPGRHAIIMQDDPNYSRLRFKTAEGHQIIFDDANERIYISTARGNSWVEMDQDGHINIFGSDSISIRSGKDINFTADRDINFEAERNFNLKTVTGEIKMLAQTNIQLKSIGNTVIAACGFFDMSTEKTLKMTSINDMDIRSHTAMRITGDKSIDIKAGTSIKQTASKIDLNGPPAAIAKDASCAEYATKPSITPGFEPWKRDVSDVPRGPYWKA